MTKNEIKQLDDLLTKLAGERLKELDEEYPDVGVYDLDAEDLYELDDYDRLIEGIDLVQTCLSEMRGE